MREFSYLHKNFWIILATICLIALFSILSLTYYVNYHLPHGTFYPTGDYNCKNDGRGPCEEDYFEDMSDLSIPDWAKFVRRYWFFAFMSLTVFGLLAKEKHKIKIASDKENELLQNIALKETLRLVSSSTRPMPAHFTSNGERRESFCIDFVPLSANIDTAMASEAWWSHGYFLSTEKCGSENLSQGQTSAVIKCAEDLMVGAFILTKLNGSSLMVEMKRVIICDVVENLKDKIEGLEAVLTGQQVNKYFDYCIEYGQYGRANVA